MTLNQFLDKVCCDNDISVRVQMVLITLLDPNHNDLEAHELTHDEMEELKEYIFDFCDSLNRLIETNQRRAELFLRTTLHWSVNDIDVLPVRFKTIHDAKNGLYRSRLKDL